MRFFFGFATACAATSSFAISRMALEKSAPRLGEDGRVARG